MSHEDRLDSQNITTVTVVKTIPELSKPAFGVLPKTGDAEPEDPGKPGWERSRTICARSILAWRRQGDALGIDRHGVHSWRRLRLLDMLRRERGRITQCGYPLSRYSDWDCVWHKKLNGQVDEVDRVAHQLPCIDRFAQLDRFRSLERAWWLAGMVCHDMLLKHHLSTSGSYWRNGRLQPLDFIDNTIHVQTNTESVQCLSKK